MKKERKKWKIYSSIFNRYVNFYHDELLKNEIYSVARDYLKNRSLNKDQVKKFKIGYVNKNPNFFEKFKKDFNIEDLLETGLFYLDEKKKFMLKGSEGV